jgi:hypothetical protein
MLNSAWLSQAVYVAARLDVAERLRAGPFTAGELAQQCGAQATPLLQVLRALSGYGVFTQDGQGRFALNDMAQPLLHDALFSIQPYVRVWGEQLFPAAGQLLRQVQSGKSAFELAHGQSIWEFYRAHPSEGDIFDAFMSAATDMQNGFIAAALHFASFRRVVDVGAGRGSLLSAALRKAPELLGVWYDRVEVLPEAQSRLASEGLADRCELVAGSFLESVPTGADLYLIKHVLHDWHDEPATQIVANIAAAMGEQAKLVIIEAVMDGRDRADGLCKVRDLEQMFWTGGRVRTRDDFERLLHPSGLVIQKITRTPIVDVCLIEVHRRS